MSKDEAYKVTLECDAYDTACELSRAILGIRTLEAQNSDSLDFHDLAVWQIRQALVTAFKIGREGK